MAFRFRRSVKLAPGIRVNFGKRGVSLSAGIRGASLTMGRHGIYGNVGIPGTGMSLRERLDRPSGQRSASASRSSRSAAASGFACILALSDDGTVTFQDDAGNSLPSRLVKVVREQRSAELQRWLEEQCENWNKGINVLLRSHHGTPVPFQIPTHRGMPFDEPRPAEPPTLQPGLFGKSWCRIWRPARERLEAENARRTLQHQQAVAEWIRAKEQHETGERERRRQFDAAMEGAPQAMQAYFEQRLQGIEFPWNSGALFDVLAESLWIDLDLPEIEDLPTEQATVSARGVKINIKTLSDTQIRKEYMALVHALAFRVAGEAFAALPAISEVVVSAFSQRADKATGHIADEYLLSARIPRDEWRRLNWSAIETVDPVETFTRFDLIRRMTATGVFRPITPHEPKNV